MEQPLNTKKVDKYECKVAPTLLTGEKTDEFG
jgi:hypothetical protein